MRMNQALLGPYPFAGPLPCAKKGKNENDQQTRNFTKLTQNGVGLTTWLGELKVIFYDDPDRMAVELWFILLPVQVFVG